MFFFFIVEMVHSFNAATKMTIRRRRLPFSSRTLSLYHEKHIEFRGIKSEAIQTGYRWRYSFKDSLLSLFVLHNDTWNIWTHILAFLCFSYLLWKLPAGKPDCNSCRAAMMICLLYWFWSCARAPRECLDSWYSRFLVLSHHSANMLLTEFNLPFATVHEPTTLQFLVHAGSLRHLSLDNRKLRHWDSQRILLWPASRDRIFAHTGSTSRHRYAVHTLPEISGCGVR